MLANGYLPSILRVIRAGQIVVIALFALALAALAQENEEAPPPRDYLELQHELSLDFVTPHTEWAKPYAQGTTRALFFVSWAQGSTDGREIVELMERFDLDADAVYYLKGSRLLGDGRPDWYGGDPEAGTKRVLRLLSGPVDVLFFNQFEVDGLPETVRDAIAEKVRQGTGLVLVGKKQKKHFPEVQPLENPPSELPAGRYFTLGAGRVAFLPPREELEYHLGWETEFDYQMADQGRVLLWAAKHEPAVGITIALNSSEIDRDRLGDNPVQVRVEADGVSGEARALLRRWDGQTAELGHFDFPASANLTLPLVRSGEYHVDVIANVSNGVANWASAPLVVTDERRVTSVELVKDWAEVGETIQGHVVTEDALGDTDSVILRLVDSEDRVLQQEDVSPDNGARFSIQVRPWMPPLMRVEAAIRDGEDEVASAYQYLKVTNRNRDQFNFVMWNLATGDLTPYMAESLAKNGVTAVLQGGKPPLFMAQYGLSFVPYASSFRASSHTTTAMLDPETGVLKTGCVHDDEKMWQQVHDTADRMQEARQLGVFAYSLGDENAVRASCLSPYCLDAYRQYLKDLYGTIGALNEEWESGYGTFGEIELLAEGELPAADAPQWFKQYFADWNLLHHTDNEGAEGEALERQVAMGAINDELRALQAGNFARWYDRQEFQNRNYLIWCKRFQQAFREIDPIAWTGFEGTDSFTIRKLTTRSRQGGDLDAFVREMDYFGPYEGPANEVVRSIASPEFPKGNWIGYDPELDVLIHKYWSQVTDNMNAVQWWRWDNLDGYNGYLMPTLSPYPAVRELLEDTAVVREGLGTLLMHCQMQDDGIAMLYSLPSTYIAHFDGNDTYGLEKRDHGQWHKLIHGAGLQFRYVTDRMLRRGEFDASKYKVLILPLSFAMSPEEANVIRAFVEGGGTVIADVRPAIYDGHCKPLEQGLLDDVFGIRRTGNREAEKVDRLRVDGEINGQSVRMDWGNWHGKEIYPRMVVDPNVELTTGEKRGDAYHIHYWTGLESPLCILNQYGKGQAILLNFSLNNAPAGRFLGDLLAACGVDPVVKVAMPDGQPLRDIEITRWANGDSALLALFGTYDGEVVVQLPAVQNIYDLKQHKGLGAMSSFATRLRANRASFFALHSDPIPLPVVSVSRNPVQRGGELMLSVQLPEARYGDPVQVNLIDPDGDPAAWFAKTVVVGENPVSVPIAFALNDPPGDWIVRVADLLSAHTSEANVHVQ